MQLDSDRRFRFPVPPEALWAAIARTEDYRRWWPWLTAFEVGGSEAGGSGAGGLVAGDVWRCAVRPPLPYTLRFAIHLDEVVPRSLVRATLRGDIAGAARLEVAPHAGGCDVRLTSTLIPSSRAFGMVAKLAAPIVRRGHDWVLDAGARQFVQRAVQRG